MSAPCRLALIPVLVVSCLVAAHAGGGPENVALVVNADSWASLTVAHEYQALRHLPPTNLVYLSGLSRFDHVPLDYFRERILLPVLAALQERGLRGQIDYLVYSADLPTNADAWVDLTGEQPLDRMPRHCASPYLSTTALTFLYPLTLSRNLAYLDLEANRYARPLQQERWDEAPWTEEQRARLGEAQQFLRERRRRAAERTRDNTPATEADLQWEREGAAAAAAQLTALLEAHPNSAEVLYSLACAQALTEQPVAALQSLRSAAASGWTNLAQLDRDEDLGSLRELPEFAALREELRNRRYTPLPSHGFRSSYGWRRDGVAPPDQAAPSYLLSTFLAVTSGRGNSVAEALASLRRSVAADGTRPAGTIYYLRHGDIRSTTRSWAFPSAVADLQELGVGAAIAEAELPRAAQDAAGVMAGSASFDWPGSGSRLLPGAFAEHLTSYGGALEPHWGQTPITEWIRHGAAGSTGTVAEPFALFNKFPNPWVHLHYARGCSLAEAIYQSVPGPYHLLVIGDPLCAPWAVAPELQVAGVEPGELLTERRSLTLAPGLDPQTFDHVELFVDGVRRATAPAKGSLEVDPATLADGWHELRVVGVASGPIETQSRVVLPIFIRSRATELELTPAAAEVSWDQPLELYVACPGAREIAVLHNLRVVGRVVGERGALRLDPRLMGWGTGQLHPVALLATGRQLRGAPVTVRVVAPACWPALAEPTGNLAPGLRLRAGGRAPMALEKVAADSLPTAGVKPAEAFEVEAWFEVPADETYQFQARIASGQAAVQVDGKRLGATREGAWAYLPVPLQRGWHRVLLSGVAEAPVALEANFGGPGTAPLSGPTFRSPEE